MCLILCFSILGTCRLSTYWTKRSVCDTLGDLVTCAQFKKRENTHGGVLLLVKLQTEGCNFTKSNTSLWVFFAFFKLYK